jgi:hypothetical protein
VTITFTHGRDCPHRCSLCLGASAKRVELTDGQVTIDGEPAGRTPERGMPARMRASIARGGRR